MIKQTIHDILDMQEGNNDGVSLAYNIGNDSLAYEQAIKANAWRGEHYLRGFIEGFNLIAGKAKNSNQQAGFKNV